MSLEQLLGQVHDAKRMVDLGQNEAGRSKGWRADIRQAGTLSGDPYDRRLAVVGPVNLTYVKTPSGWVYVAFIVDVFSRFVVGWQASRSLPTDLALDALEMAIWGRRGEQLHGLGHHSDRGVQGRFKGWSQRRLVDMSQGTRPRLRLESSSQASCGGGC